MLFYNCFYILVFFIYIVLFYAHKTSLKSFSYSFFQLLTHIFKTFPLFFFFFTLKSKNCTHKMQNASHLLQNEALHSKYDEHILKANIFALILIPLRLLCYFENCVCFSKSVLWNWKLSQRPRTSVWFCRFGVWLCCLRARFQKLCDKQRFSV